MDCCGVVVVECDVGGDEGGVEVNVGVGKCELDV